MGTLPEVKTICAVSAWGSRGAGPRRSTTRRAIADEIAPCFVAGDGRRTDTIVLACTHYPLLIERFSALAPWPVAWLDPAPAIARRVVDLLGPAEGPAAGAAPQILFTSGRLPPPPLARALAGCGFAAAFDTPALPA